MRKTITDAQFRLARLFEQAGLCTISQAVKAFERHEHDRIEEWKKLLDAKQLDAKQFDDK